jgi:hypothetical protein
MESSSKQESWQMVAKWAGSIKSLISDRVRRFTMGHRRARSAGHDSTGLLKGDPPADHNPFPGWDVLRD